MEHDDFVIVPIFRLASVEVDSVCSEFLLGGRRSWLMSTAGRASLVIDRGVHPWRYFSEKFSQRPVGRVLITAILSTDSSTPGKFALSRSGYANRQPVPFYCGFLDNTM